MLSEAHERALAIAYSDTQANDNQPTELVRQYLRSMASQGFVMVPVEATEEMKLAWLGAIPRPDETWRAMVEARDKLEDGS